jgi:nucleoside-triphosphatase THEP1
MHSWVAEPSSSSSMSIFWLAGLAGTGKSTIVKTFCERVSNDDRFLLASFFASRNSAERRDPYRILHTFAYQLAVASDRIRSHVLSAARAPQDVMQEPMQEQVKQLLAEPIKRAQLFGRTIVFAIDALDECQKSPAGVEGGPLIELLALLLQDQPVKLLVASRQEDSIANMFRSLSHVPLRLHEISSAVVEADIRRILNAGFADMWRRRARDIGTDLWPTESQLNTLVQLTGPFFIYASTVLKFVDGPRFSPQRRLRQILERGSVISTDSSNPYLQVDALYADVLKSATEEAPGCTNAELCWRVGNLLRTIVLLEKPVSVLALAHLMGILEFEEIQQMENDVRALGSVLLISDAPGSERFSGTVSTFHPSFRDFLVDRQRCSEERFLVRPAENQHELLYHCLQLLNRHLRHDVCGIRNPGLANEDIQHLPERLTQSVPESARYACCFWQIHLVACDLLTESVSAALLELCTDHLLHWLEALSLLGEVSSASKHLPRSIVWCQVSTSPAS